MSTIPKTIVISLLIIVKVVPLNHISNLIRILIGWMFLHNLYKAVNTLKNYLYCIEILNRSIFLKKITSGKLAILALHAISPTNQRKLNKCTWLVVPSICLYKPLNKTSIHSKQIPLHLVSYFSIWLQNNSLGLVTVENKLSKTIKKKNIQFKKFKIFPNTIKYILKVYVKLI
jgi:hypothetical protein